MQAIKEATAYRSVTKSSKPLPWAFGNCSKVINSGAKKNAVLNKRPMQDIRVKVIFVVIFILQLSNSCAVNSPKNGTILYKN